MSAHFLSDDMSSWPSDDFELFNLAPDTTQQAARSAYARLIRRFRPDTHPEEFKRIRESYDRVSEQIHMREFIDGVAESAGIHLDSHDTPISHEPPSDAWQLAIDGQYASAYASLNRQWAGGEFSVENCVQRYWLVKLNPTLDEALHCAEILLEGMIRTNEGIPLLELYRREIDFDPQIVKRPRSEKLYAQLSLNHEFVETLSLQRWHAFFRIGDCQRVAQDIELLREQHASNEPLWARLLLYAIDYLAWSTHINFGLRDFRKYEAELNSMTSVQLSLQHEFDRMDHLLLLSDLWRASRANLQELNIWLNAAPICWLEPATETRRHLDSLLQWIGTHPSDAIRSFDWLLEEATPIGSLISQQFQAAMLLRSDEPRAISAETIDQLKSFAAQNPKSGYAKMRTVLLDLCIQDGISANEIMNLIATGRLPWPENVWSVHLEDELALQTIVLGSHLFWDSH